MEPITKEACRLLIECMDELRLFEWHHDHETNPVLKERLQAFMVKHGLDNPENVVNKLCD